MDSFTPTLRGIFVNPFYLIRKGLYFNIQELSVKMTGKLLDYGCGSKPYKHMFTVTDYIGVDMINPAYEKQSDKIDYFIKDGEIPFADNYFDSVLCTEVLEHVFNIDEVLTEINRVLKPGGKFLITIPFIWEEHEMPYDFARYSSLGIEAILQKHKFVVQEHRKIGNSFETIYQLKVMEVYYWLTHNVSNIFLRKKLGLILIPYYNIKALIINKLFSNNNPNLYLNNVILVVKK
jgi:SAM-dependent methyltransferase